MRISIVHIITDLSVGGAEIMLCKLLSRMDHSRFQNSVVSLTDKGTLGSRIEKLGVPVLALGMRREVPNPLLLLHLLRILWKEKPHVLQTWLYHADLMGLLAGKLMRVPVIAWNLRCSNMDMTRYSKLSALVVYATAKLSSFPDVVLVNSRAGQQLHETLGYCPARWQLIPNGFDVEQFRPNLEARIKLRQELGLPADTLLIGYIARFDPMKDHASFLRAASLLLKDNPDAHFVLVGRGIDNDNGKLVKYTASLDIKNKVHLLGERKDIPDITAALDIASSSSYGEGFPNVIGEAMACGVPCVVTDVGDSALLVGDTGKVVPPKDTQALARAWQGLIEIGREGRKQLGLAARRRIEENFSLPAIVAQYEKLYEELSKCAE